MINTVTLNPALDHIFYLNCFERNITNRIAQKTTTMGGKGTHVSMNLAVMNEPNRAYGFGFGKNGRRIIDMLTESHVTPRFVYDADYGESRDNYLIVENDTRDATLIANKGPAPMQAHVEALYQMIEDDLTKGESLNLSGDASNFTDPFAYNRIMERLAPKKCRIFLDASGETLLRAVSLDPFLIKPNQGEMSLLLDRPLNTLQDVIHAIAELDRKQDIYAIVVSLGGDGAVARIGDTLYRIKSPKVNVYNTVGCGDCMMAGLLYGFEHHMATEDILRHATACSAATAESPLSVGFDADRAKRLLPLVDISRI